MKVLVVVDMQNDFITGSLGTKEAQEVVSNVCEQIGMGSYDEIYYTMDTHDEKYLETHEGSYLQIEHCIKDTIGWCVEPHVWAKLEKQIDNLDCRVIRIQKSTFGSYELVRRLSFATEIHICGVCTDICVISNALMLKSCLPETDITVIATACAGTTPEMHQKALDVMRGCQINIRYYMKGGEW